ncbi:dihydrofolate reductase family protein [Nocardia sp. NEAU-G5]|uniref:Dihydrofolate reductase family protein n=1 Tax=Nocardia albiluteola TaxID=2842303 RepID=A0ABS6AYX7_9NOCA|nr:dihydrofolate reductase family protein [Nocardia albiluteola]MBU3062200.1 dihydrofolate reductase family protein [Nocardia albiluteola]
MTKVLWHITMSLDGFIAPADDSVEWMFGHGSAGPLGMETVERTGAVLSGRRGYDLGNRLGEGNRKLYGGMWSGPMFVLTHRPGEVPEDPRVRFLSGGVADAVATAQAAAGAGAVGIFGADLARQCIELGLLDEIVVHLVPILLGGGVRLFDGVGPVRLRKVRGDDSGQITDLRFEIVREDSARR